MHPRDGVIYVASGTDYRDLAIASARSLRAVEPGLAMDLFTDTPDAVPPGLFDMLHPIARPEPRSKLTCMAATRFDRTLFLDADTLVLAPLGDVILNYSTHRRRRVDVIFKVPLKADIVGVLQRLRERVDADPRVRKDPPPLIEMMDLTEAYAQAAIRVWVARDDVSAVRTDLMLSAHLLTDDPRAELPPPRPSSARDQSAPIPGKPRFSLKAPGRGRKSGPNSPLSPPKA